MNEEELLQAYKNMSDNFDDFTQLMRQKIPYGSWPDKMKVSGITPDSNDDILPITPPPLPPSFFEDQMLKYSGDCVSNLKEVIAREWRNVQSDCRPDVSFRAMFQVMEKWVEYIEDNKRKNNTTHAQMRIQDLGRAEEKVKHMLEDGIFNKLHKHNPYWYDSDEETADKLDDIRCKFSCLHDNLWELLMVLRDKEEE